MSFATTVTHTVTVLESVTGIENAYETPLTSTSRATTEASRSIRAGEKMQSWEVIGTPIQSHQGASGMNRTRAKIRIRAWWFHKDQDPLSLVAFRNILAAVGVALMDPDAGFPQINDAGVQTVVEPDMPRISPTGHSGWYAELVFETLDCEHT